MAILHAYAGPGGAALPRVVTISVTRAPGERSDRFVVRMHEEGTAVAWRRDVALRESTRTALTNNLVVLDDFAEGLTAAAAGARRSADRIGRRLFATFLGADGAEFIREHAPTAIMIDADETALDLPWELLRDDEGLFIERWPFGRLVTTTTRPKPERNPSDEDATIAVLAVVDPSREFTGTDDEIAALQGLAEVGTLRLDVLQGEEATSGALAYLIAKTPYDVVHFSAHGGFIDARPGQSGLMLADGPLLTKQLLALPWNKPPYLAVVSACWSGRAAAGHRLTSSRSGSNGVAAAFLASGASSCLGFGWPVHITTAAQFVTEFYRSLVENVNVGVAVLDARRALLPAFREQGELVAPAAVFYGDVGTATRRDVDMAKPRTSPEPKDPTRRDIAMAS